MEFWIFSLDDPNLYRFYNTQADNVSLYYILYIEEANIDLSAEAKEVLHLRNETILLIDRYLLPIYNRMPLKGYLILLTEEFCEMDAIKALLKLVFFHNTPEGITDLGTVTEDQKKCLSLIYEEYNNTADNLRALILKTLTVNLLLSSTINFSPQLKSGHLLNYALQCMDLVNKHATHERNKSFYVNELGTTEKILTEALQVIFKKTFKELLIYRTVIEALQLLVFTNKSVSQIAHELNYDASGFNKLFLKWKGMAPKNIRTNYRKIIHDIENIY